MPNTPESILHENRLVNGRPTHLYGVALRMAYGDIPKANAIHGNLVQFIYRMAVNDIATTPIDVTQRNIDLIVSDTAAELKEIRNK